jgi:hypothetical protein
MVGTLVTLIVGATIVGVLGSGQDRERDLEDVAASQEQLHDVMGMVLKDVRAAEPLWFETATTPATQLGMRRLDPATGATAYVRWRIVTSPPAAPTLVRETVQLDPVTRAVTSSSVNVSLRGLDATISPFAYFTRSGAQVSGATTAPYTDCTSQVMVTLRAAPSRGRHPVTLISEGQLRSRADTPWWCP